MKKFLLRLSNSAAVLQRKRSNKLLAVLTALAVVALCATSCKAWRTITTSATYVQQSDSAKTSTTISTKTSEEYVGIRKR